MAGQTKYLAKGDHKMGKGRPETWTEEKLDELAKNVMDYADRSDALDILTWRADCQFTRNQVKHFCDRSEYFRNTYENAKAKIGARRSSLALKGDISERIYLKEQWNFDEDLRCREDEKDKRKVEQQMSLLAQIQASEDLVNKADPSSNIPMEKQD